MTVALQINIMLSLSGGKTPLIPTLMSKIKIYTGQFKKQHYKVKTALRV